MTTTDAITGVALLRVHSHKAKQAYVGALFPCTTVMALREEIEEHIGTTGKRGIRHVSERLPCAIYHAHGEGAVCHALGSLTHGKNRAHNKYFYFP
jgi:hypothetical protein